MRVASDLHVEWVDDEAVVLHTRTKEIHYLNGAAALFLALVVERGVEGAMQRLREEFHGTEGLETELEALVADMTEKGLLEDE